MSLISDTYKLTRRLLRNTLRMPFFVFITIFQPLVWLFLFSALFGGVTGDYSEFGSYAGFLAPGIAVMSAFYGSVYAGFSVSSDIKSNVVERLRCAPINRLSIPFSYCFHNGVLVAFQAFFVLVVAYFLGYLSWVSIPGLVAIVAVCTLLGLLFGTLSIAIAFLTKSHETLLSIVNFLTLPLLFTSSLLIQSAGMPGWMQSVAQVNPLNWAIVMARHMAANSWQPQTFLYCGLMLVSVLLVLRLMSSCFKKYEANN